MTDKELLSSIANLINTNSKMLEKRMDTMEERLNNKIDFVEHSLNDKIDCVEQRLNDKIDRVEQRLSGRMDGLEGRMNGLENRIDSLDSKIDRVETSLKHEIHQINLKLENNIEPRLQNIEECYLSTYERYKTSTEHIEKMQLDIEVLQDVVREHGKN